jgi:hypothetical protein
MAHPTFDSAFFTKCIIDWIHADGEIFISDVVNANNKSRRYNRTNKINYWETPWGELLRNPHIQYASSRVARYIRSHYYLITFLTSYI